MSQSRQHDQADSLAKASSSAGVKHLIPSHLTRYLNLSTGKALVSRSANWIALAMAAFESQYIDRDTYSASAEDIEVQSYFFDDQLTSLSPPRNCIPPDVLLCESRQPA
nr:hypothetical protein [Tanacetum cinerariifolium]